MSDCSGCAWTKGRDGRVADTTECKKTNKLTNMEEMCPVDCFLPYPTGFFNNGDTRLKAFLCAMKTVWTLLLDHSVLFRVT